VTVLEFALPGIIEGDCALAGNDMKITVAIQFKFISFIPILRLY